MFGNAGHRNLLFFYVQMGKEIGDQLLHQGVAHLVIEAVFFKIRPADLFEDFFHAESIFEDRIGKAIIVGNSTKQVIREESHIHGRAGIRQNGVNGLTAQEKAMSSGQITKVIKEANYDDDCLGVVTWCHTFSPSKMWLTGVELLQKPWCHFATQYNLEIPNEEIDMDFMNLNQAAHGDREHGFIGARLRKARKVVAGYWKNEDVIARLAEFEKVCVGIDFSKNLKVMRFNDNMRDVAVTEGDKVEAQKKLGWEVNTWAVGDLVKEMNAVTDEEVEAPYSEYLAAYNVNTDNTYAIKYQAREEIAMKKMMDRNIIWQRMQNIPLAHTCSRYAPLWLETSPGSRHIISGSA